MTDVQPMKMAAAEGLYQTSQPAGFSVFTIGTLDGSDEVVSLRIPRLLSYLATGDPSAAVEGIDDLQPFDADEFLSALFPDDLLG